jgi:O-acetyl-ADP-ribose deacetylase (regulator of RNase III)
MKPLERVRDYVLWGRLAEGGMGDVWLARHVGLGVPVVLKTLKSVGALEDETRFERLLTEGRLEARLSSPHVVRVFDAGTHDGAPFLVQEYIDGLDARELSLGRREAIGRTLPLWFVCEIAAQTAHALEAAHRTGIIHRDVKPSNILGAGLEFKLADFGLAVDSPISPTAAQPSGTLNFMAPEAMRGEPIDRRTDVFSLGATAFSLRYGYSPFSSVSGTLGPEPVRFPRPLDTEEAAFQDLIARMLAKSPRERPPDLANPRRLLTSLASVSRAPVSCSRGADGSYMLRETTFTCEEGDISAQRVDGIVNSANHELRMRHGVAGALRGRGGDAIEQEAMAGGERPLGACVVTGPGRLLCTHVLHAVCAWQAASCVGRAMQSTLIAAERLGLSSLAIPALGTGAAGVSLEASAAAIATAVRTHVLIAGSRLRRLSFVLYDAEKTRVFRDVFESVFLADASAPVDAGLPTPSFAFDDKTAIGTKLGP